MLERDWIGFDPDKATDLDQQHAWLDKQALQQIGDVLSDPWADLPATPVDPYPDPVIPGTEAV